MITELLLILCITVIVFGPKDLPKLARHLGQLVRFINQFKKTSTTIFEQALLEAQLIENKDKANQADAFYSEKQEKEENNTPRQEDTNRACEPDINRL